MRPFSGCEPAVDTNDQTPSWNPVS